jgi:hypothetical protein
LASEGYGSLEPRPLRCRLSRIRSNLRPCYRPISDGQESAVTAVLTDWGELTIAARDGLRVLPTDAEITGWTLKPEVDPIGWTETGVT